ncbi:MULTISPECIES: IS630 transposase-related protein [Xenorhabdus]|uniref:IS630 transposase-related protein n=1 Tax=Xenorhabdus TaxID=626 RepID=UPI0009F8C7CE|nr:IS630 transposase-related protein [Xenorhabdus griffiniae]
MAHHFVSYQALHDKPAKPATKIPDPVLIADIQNFPDDYQWKSAKRLGVSQSAMYYALKRLRCFGSHDWHAKGRINVIGAILEKTLVTLSLFTGNIHNAGIFHAWMT